MFTDQYYTFDLKIIIYQIHTYIIIKNISYYVINDSFVFYTYMNNIFLLIFHCKIICINIKN